ncbi:MAG: hypothetical protein GF331_02920 [Chitinivibrionales bacterium]|nr:hypothetical protein [Chitinivibrionales bacterium]
MAPTRETTDCRLLDRAIALAAAVSADGAAGPFGAVVARGEEVLGEGWNRVVGQHDPTAHAEIVAIRAACHALGDHALTGCTLYSSCEPCPMCLGAIYWARIDRVVYASTRADAAGAGFDDARIYDELARPEAERSIEMMRIERPRAGQTLADWARNPHRQGY